jgi:phosphoglycolate phosphatase-like HAD superfamily hydrolase
MAERTEGRVRLRDFPVLFWDFDGVIKDSVGGKADAFERLFVPFGGDVARRVRSHHERHGGVSRYDKLPLYLQWAGQPCTADEVARYAERFSTAVREAVVECGWVPGAREYLEKFHDDQVFMLISATPQAEIEAIVARIGASPWFRKIFGAPVPKADAIVESLAGLGYARTDALVIGDSESDYQAAVEAKVAFLLRRTELNLELQSRYAGPSCARFDEW